MTENNQTTNTNKGKFYCDNCQQIKEGSFARGSYVKRLVDAPFAPQMHKRICFICTECRPYVKEYNEAQDRDKEDNPYRIN